MSRFTVEQRAALVRKYHRSGLSIAEFARQNNINARTFGYWMRTYSKNDKTANLEEVSSPHLHPLEIVGKPEEEQQHKASLTFPNGVTLELFNATISQISQLVNNYSQCSR